ncbi:MAG: agmatinase [Thermomicrobiales bacterium]|nr:agmatinase [Thermomicrobiales bacterium]
MRYRPEDSLLTPRFTGVRTFMRLPNIRTLQDVDFVVTGIPFDTAASVATGQRFGPEAIRSASILLRPYDLDLEIDIFDHASGVDYGDVTIVPGYIDDTFGRIERDFAEIAAAGVVPIAMGGDHSITLAELRGLVKRYGPIAVLHFDAHLDTWDEFFGHRYDHGTTFRRAVEEGLVATQHSAQIGIRGPQFSPKDLDVSRALGFDVITMSQLRLAGIPATVQRIRDRVGDVPAFISFDVDAVDPAFAPGTGTPEVGGFASHEIMTLLAGLAGLRFVGYDVVEVLPASDPARITALLAANVMHRFLGLHAVQQRDRVAAVSPRTGREPAKEQTTHGRLVE